MLPLDADRRQGISGDENRQQLNELCDWTQNGTKNPTTLQMYAFINIVIDGPEN